MFEAIIALFIKRYLARYIQINAEQLSAQLLYKQQIVIENLKFNKTTLNEDIQTNFQLPIAIQSIDIGRIQCSFVWSALFFRSSSAALMIKIEGVHVVISEKDEAVSTDHIVDDDEENKYAQLDLAEQQLEKELECFGEVNSSRWNVRRLLTAFLEKLQIEILDVHLRYESTKDYTIGLTCQQIQISNESSEQTIHQQVFRLINPAFYIDIHHPSTHSYILSPSTSIEIYLVHNHFLLPEGQYQYEVQCSLNDLNLRCNTDQIGILADILRSIQYFSYRRMLFSDPSRPHSTVSQATAKAWWRYIALTVLRTQVQTEISTRRLWFNRSLLVHRLHQLSTYQRLYRAYLDDKDLLSEEESVMKTIEREWNIDHLLIIRRSIFQKRIDEQYHEKREAVRWYSTYAKWITNKVIDLWGSVPVAEENEIILNETDIQLQEQVNTFIAESLEDEDRLESCQNTLTFHWKLAFKSVQLDLLSLENDILFSFYLKNLSTRTEFQVHYQSVSTAVFLEDFYVCDRKQLDAFSTIICSKEGQTKQLPMFELSLEKKIESKRSRKSTYTIDIRSCGVQIICSPASAERLQRFFLAAFNQSNSSLSLSLYHWKQIKDDIINQIISILEYIIPKPTVNSKKRTTSYLRNITRNRHRRKTKFHVSLEIAAPKLIIPLLSENDLIIDLGYLILNNEAQNRNSTKEAVSACTAHCEDDDEFLTPDSSPPATDHLDEEETEYYSLNIIPTDEIEYSSFSLSIRDIQASSSPELLPIVDTLTVSFLIENPLDHVWPLRTISGTLSKLTVHLNASIIQSLYCSAKPWIPLIKNCLFKQRYRFHVLPTLNFRLEEVNLLLDDNSHVLCDIRVQNIDLFYSHSVDRNISAKIEDTHVHVHSISLPVEVRVRNVLIEILFKSVISRIKATINTLQMFHQPDDLIVTLTDPLHLSFAIMENNNCNLSIEIPSVTYFHTIDRIYGVQQILHFIRTNYHWLGILQLQKEHYLLRSTLNIVLNKSTIIVPIGIAVEFNHLRIEKNEDQLSECEIHMDRIDLTSPDRLEMKKNFQLLENISISLRLQTSFTIDSKLISPLHVFLSHHRIQLLQRILKTFFVQHGTLFSKLTFHLQPSSVTINFQTDRNDQTITICQGRLDRCQMSYDFDRSTHQHITVRFTSLQIKENLDDSEEPWIVLKSPSLMELHTTRSDYQHKQFRMKLGDIDVNFSQSVGTILSELIEIFGKRDSQAKDRLTDFSVDIDTISCLFRENSKPLMTVSLQHLTCQYQFSSKQSIISSSIHGQLYSISLRDLSIIDQLYSERLSSTTTSNVITFSFITGQNDCSQFNLQISSIQYIHTLPFLLSVIKSLEYFRSLIIKPVSLKNKILFNLQTDKLTLIVPEDILSRAVLIFQLGSINLKNQLKHLSPLELISIGIKDATINSALSCGTDNTSSIHFEKYSSLIREPFHIQIEIEYHFDKVINPTLPNYIVKMHLSSIEILFDYNLYRSLQNTLPSMINRNFIRPLTVAKDDLYADFVITIEIDQVGLEIFVPSLNQRRSLGCMTLRNMHLSFDQYTNGNHSLHLLCPTLELVDTRIQNENLIVPLSNSSNDNTLEVYLSSTQQDKKCVITLNSIRFFFAIDWFLQLNEFLHAFSNTNDETVVRSISIPSVDLKINLNQFELALVSTMTDPYSSTLVYSSTMSLDYQHVTRFLECLISDLTFFTCQIGSIDETTVSVIEPIDCSFQIHPADDGEQTFEMDIPLLNIRLSYSDVKMLWSLFQSISQQISQAKTRKPLLTYITAIITSPLRESSSSTNRLLKIKFLRLICEQICLCLIDDCFGVNIPLLNINLEPFHLQTIENCQSHRTDQSEFQLNISYYNRFQSGFEPLIERCPLQIILTRSPSSTSLAISSQETLNLNFTKAMYRLYGTIKNNWMKDHQQSTEKSHFRRVKPLEPYCLKNCIGLPIKFRTWITAEQRFASHEYLVDDHQTVSFYFSTLNDKAKQRSPVRLRTNSIVTSLFQTDRRLLIAIDGWHSLKPLSIDRVGTFFRLAVPSNDNSNGLCHAILLIIEIAMTENSIRSITIKSPIEIRNQLQTAIDIRLQTVFDQTEEFCLEPNEVRSLPIQFYSIIEQLQLRPANFALDYCDEPIQWSEIDCKTISMENPLHQQSFLRICSIDGKEAVYHVCFQSKQTYLTTYANQTLSIYQLSIHPPLTICNLLPCALAFQLLPYSQSFQLNAYKSHREHTLNIRRDINLVFSTNLYRMTKPFHLPSINDLSQMECTRHQVIFYDSNQRELFVDVTIVCRIRYRWKISVSVPYVLLNRSGIPLIFKDATSKASVEASGQTGENEGTSNREPLLFSFENPNRNNACVMRVGSNLHDGRPQWSPRFSLERGSTHRQLQVRSGRNSSDWNYSIAVDIRSGNGHLKNIKFVFLSARYMICNQCSHDLVISQRQLTTDRTHDVHVSPHATIPFHWPRTDLDQLLCVRVVDDDQYQSIHWSGAFQIGSIQGLYLNMRDEQGRCVFLRVQVIQRNQTYFVLFMDANQMPAPFRISNRSDVPIEFYQTDVPQESTHLRTSIEPSQSIDYAWDEPTLKPLLTCSISEGSRANYDVLKLGSGEDLYYRNSSYLVIQETTSSSDHPLVIEYLDNRLIIAQRQANKRSQLWQMTNDGFFIHLGSSPINHDFNKKKEHIEDVRQAFVLDIEDTLDQNFNVQSTSLTPLIVKRYDPKRTLTQTWQLLDSGYLCPLTETQLCVQVFGELKENSDVILGPMIVAENTCPLATMHIRADQCYKGSGVLAVRVITDGPTNVLEIDHIETTDLSHPKMITSSSSSILSHFDLYFPAGVGISMIGSLGHESEELIYVLVNNLCIKYTRQNDERSLEGTIKALSISNQLLTTTKPSFLHAIATEDAIDPSAIHLKINWQRSNRKFSLLRIIDSLRIDMNTLTIQLDEVLLWKLIDFFDVEVSSFSSLLFSAIGIGANRHADRQIDLNISEYETERILSLLTSTKASRIYFNKLYLSAIQLHLSIYCIQARRSLSPHLLSVKRLASFPLVPFENARIILKSYEQTHLFNTYDFFLLSIMTHYINVCTRQALKILGSADYLGNPLGLIHDVSDGLNCLVDQGSVTGLVKNVAHGVANSTSKVTGSLSQGLGRLVSDKEHDDRRQTIADDHSHRSSSFGRVIRHGTANLAAGFYGGLTSMIKQPYRGALEEGMPGLVKGFARGIVGTVSKPVVGILDFTNDVAMAVKEGSRLPNAALHSRFRLTRCPSNMFGLLQPYSIVDAQGHYILYKINRGNSTERYFSRLTLSTSQTKGNSQRDRSVTSDRREEYIHAMITSQRVIIYRTDDDPDPSNFDIIHSYDFHRAMTVVPIENDEDDVYIQFLIDSKSSIHRCDTIEQASIFSGDVQRAQEIFEDEKLISVPVDDENNESFDEQQTE